MVEVRVRDGRTIITVAANDAPSDMKAKADYQCDGIHDEVEILMAMTDAHVLDAGLMFTSGVFKIDEKGE